LITNYNPVTGAITGPVGALPIQTPVSPNGRNMVTANNGWVQNLPAVWKNQLTPARRNPIP